VKTRGTDRLIALQFLAVVLPVVVVLLMQMVADSRRAAALGHSRPLHELAQHARADYKSFMSGVGDAVDTGTLSSQAAEALAAAADGLGKLGLQGESDLVGSAPGTVKALSDALAKGAAITAIMPLREKIKLADKLTKDIDDELARRDAAVVEDAVTSARHQQIAVVAALFVSFLITALFVVSTQRRLRRQVTTDQQFAEEGLRRQLAADRQVAEESLRVRNALDNCSIGIIVADASGAVVHANRAASMQLAPADHVLRARGFSEGCIRLVGGHLDQLAGKAGLTASLTRRHTGDVELDGSMFRMAIDPVLDENGARVGYVVEWADRTPEIALEREVAAVVAAAARGDFSQRIGSQAAGTSGGVNEFNHQLTAGINRLLETSQVGLEDIARVLEAFAGGDLTERIHRDYEGTFAKVKAFSNRTAATLEVMIGKIKQASDSIATATREISRGNQHLSERTEQQAAGLEEAVSSIADITGVVRTNSQGAQQASAHADGALNVARQGGQIVHQLVNTMSDITASSAKINDIIEVIDGIAFQTNILALNAAVEAARAGEQGRGFSVVASEVRTLAQRSRSAAKEIRELIGSSVEQVREGSKLVDTAGKTMSEIVDAVERVTTIIGEISESSQAQTTSIEQINTAVSEIDQTTQQNAALVEEATAAAASLENQATILVNSVAAFRLSEVRGAAARGVPHAA
jgi:methyl-accepting chemotaxis protein